MLRFHWDEWNRDHATRHGVSAADAEYVVRSVDENQYRDAGDGKFAVWSRTESGELVQVVFTLKTIAELDYEALSIEDIVSLEAEGLPLVYVIHARPLTASEKRRFNRRR